MSLKERKKRRDDHSGRQEEEEKKKSEKGGGKKTERCSELEKTEKKRPYSRKEEFWSHRKPIEY